MIAYPPSLLAVGGAHTGIAPMNLLEVQDVNNNIYLWSDRRIYAPSEIIAAAQAAANAAVAAAELDLTGLSLSGGELVAWALPTKAVPDSSGSSCGAASVPFATTSGANLTQAGRACSSQCVWSGFTMPAIPTNATIVSIFQAIQATATCGGSTDVQSTSGLALLGDSTASGTFYGAVSPQNAIGVAGTNVLVKLNNTFACSEATGAADVTVTFVGVCVVYTLPPVTIPGSGGESGGVLYGDSGANGTFQYEPWLLSVGEVVFHRSQQADTISFTIQNLSGDTLSRDFEKLARLSALEGAFFVWRLWQADAQAAWLEFHGTLTVGEIGVDTVTLKGTEITNTPAWDSVETYCETCQLQWAGRRCGSTQTTECQYSFQTCQVIERPMIVLNNFEKNYGEGTANTALNVINRRRAI